MKRDTLTYGINALADPSSATSRRLSDGDVGAAIEADAEHVVRTLAEYPAGSVAVALRMLYRPAKNGDALHDRLKIFIEGSARPENTTSLQLLLEHGPFNRFYRVQRVSRFHVEEGHFSSACDIVRRQTLMWGTISGEDNPRVLPQYLMLAPFKARRDNDYLRLDSVLDRLTEPALIEVCLEPVNHAELIREHAIYLGMLQAINRPWDTDEDMLPPDLKGSSLQNITNIQPFRRREPLADLVLRTEMKNHEILLTPHFRFHIRVFASTTDTARLLASIVAESAFSDSSYQLHCSQREDGRFDRLGFNGQAMARTFPAEACFEEEWCNRRLSHLPELGTVASIDEVLGIFRLPYTSFGKPRCIRTTTDPPELPADRSLVVGYDAHDTRQDQGDEDNAEPRGIPLSDLTTHLFACGMSGSGKSLFTKGLLIQLAAEGIPFIVFEPGDKREYRALKCLKASFDPQVRELAEKLRIYTPGDETISPVRFNPIPIPEGVSEDYWNATIGSCFQASMAMFEPLPAILAESLQLVYDTCSISGRIPTMHDLYEAAEMVLSSKGYSSEVESNLRAALEVRLGSLTCRSIGQIFSCTQNLPNINDLLNGWSLVELASLSGEQQCLFMLFVLIYISTILKNTERGDGELRLVIFIEEAHNLIGRSRDTSSISDEQADPRAFASEFFCRMLAEYRSLGVAIVIIDQSPSAVAPEVVQNTATKMGFRQVDAENREILAQAMLFGAQAQEEIARLSPGWGYFHAQGYHQARLIRTPNLQAKYKIPEPPIGRSILPFIEEEPWFVEGRQALFVKDLERFESRVDVLDDQFKVASQHTKSLLTECRSILQAGKKLNAVKVGSRAREILRQLECPFVTFKQRTLRRFLEQYSPDSKRTESQKATYDRLMDRVDEVLIPAIEGCLGVLGRLVDGSHELFSIEVSTG